MTSTGDSGLVEADKIISERKNARQIQVELGKPVPLRRALATGTSTVDGCACRRWRQLRSANCSWIFEFHLSTRISRELNAVPSTIMGDCRLFLRSKIKIRRISPTPILRPLNRRADSDAFEAQILMRPRFQCALVPEILVPFSKNHLERTQT